MSRTTEKNLTELAQIASNCIEQSGYTIDVGYTYGHTNIELKTIRQFMEKKETVVKTLNYGLTMGQAAEWLRAFAEGCHYGKMGVMNKKWKWEGK